MVFNTNLGHWLGGGVRDRELRDTRQAWDETEALWRVSPFARRKTYELAIDLMLEASEEADRTPATPIMVAFSNAIDDLIRAEDVTALEADWPVVASDVAAAAELRTMLVRRRRWCGDFEHLYDILRRRVLVAYRAFFAALPESAFSHFEEGRESFEVPLIELLDDPAELINQLVLFAYDDDTLRYELFLRYRQTYVRNLLVASGFQPDANAHELSHRLIGPQGQKGKTARDLVEMYLGGTPFAEVFELPVPFHIPEEMRFEHCHIVGGTGHGKTQLMQRMIHADLIAAKHERRSVVVIDSQGDLINKLMRLELFDPDTPDSLADRLVVIDPADVEFPAALNLFDAHLDRVRSYRPVDRERVLNGVIELYEVFFGAMLGAELTQKQGVIFRYLARLMITIPEATIHTLMQLMDDGKRFKPYMDQLDGSARYFFQTEFFHPSFAATKKQILRRLWGVLSTPAFERMFAQTRNKLDLFEALNDGKIILISTAKDLLKQEGSALFGRFFIAMLAQAAQERSTLDPGDRTATFVYVDEAQEYFDDSIETILNQARKYRVGLTLAHQTLDQLSPRLRSVINANTSLKCVGGVSAKDARALADELRTTSDFIEGMRRRGERTEFAVWLKQMTPHAIRLTVPIGFLERQPLLTEEAFDAVMAANRARYCGTLADVVDFDFSEEPAAEPPPPPASTRPQPDPRQGEAEVDAPSPPKPSWEPRHERRAVEPDPIVSRTPLREPVEPRELGKGGSQHRYVQHLIKGLAEERGFRAVIEEAVEGGQIDVALHREGLSIACEISVTSKPEYEAQNLAKCLRAGFTRIWAIAPDVKRRRSIQQAAQARLAAEDFAKVEFLNTEDVIAALDGLVVPEPEEKLVRGYKVTTKRTAISPSEAKDRRAAIARILAQSTGRTDL
jgi:hypothetical protein